MKKLGLLYDPVRERELLIVLASGEVPETLSMSSPVARDGIFFDDDGILETPAAGASAIDRVDFVQTNGVTNGRASKREPAGSYPPGEKKQLSMSSNPTREAMAQGRIHHLILHGTSGCNSN